jgi:hypothetical protein
VVDLLNVTHAPDCIDSYREAMRRGERFPPISVYSLGGVFIVTDGHKRLTACKQLDVRTIDVELWSLRRLVGDLAGQSARHASAAVRAGGGLFRGRGGRQEFKLFVAATAAHWKRTVISLWRLLQPRD